MCRDVTEALEIMESLDYEEMEKLLAILRRIAAGEMIIVGQKSI